MRIFLKNVPTNSPLPYCVISISSVQILYNIEFYCFDTEIKNMKCV